MKNPSSSRSKKSKRAKPASTHAADAAVLRDRGAPTERTFVDAHHTDDALAEALGEGAIRSITSGQDDPVDERLQADVAYDDLHVVDET